MQYFDIKNILATLWSYQISHLEAWATLSGGLAVYLSAKEKAWSWILGLVNVVLAFYMFYQIQLYPDMFLQVFFFITNMVGFYLWKYPSEANSNTINERKISMLPNKNRLILFMALAFGTIVMGFFSSNLHNYFPKVFSLPSAFPYLDSFTTVASIGATFLLMYKKIEAWWVWLGVDILSTYMYFIKDIKFYSCLYAVFCVVAVFAIISWNKTLIKESRVSIKQPF